MLTAVVEELERRLETPLDRTIYVGDGSSDVHVMLHVNRTGGLTIAVSENRYLTPIAERTSERKTTIRTNAVERTRTNGAIESRASAARGRACFMRFVHRKSNATARAAPLRGVSRDTRGCS